MARSDNPVVGHRRFSHLALSLLEESSTTTRLEDSGASLLFSPSSSSTYSSLPSPAFAAFWKSLQAQLQTSFEEELAHGDDVGDNYGEGGEQEIWIINDNALSHQLPPSPSTLSSSHLYSFPNYYYSSFSSSNLEDGKAMMMMIPTTTKTIHIMVI